MMPVTFHGEGTKGVQSFALLMEASFFLVELTSVSKLTTII